MTGRRFALVILTALAALANAGRADVVVDWPAWRGPWRSP